MSKAKLFFIPKKVSFFSFVLVSVLFIGLLLATGLVGKKTFIYSKAAPQNQIYVDWAPKGAPDASWDTASEVKALLWPYDNTFNTYPKVYKYLQGCALMYPYSDDFSIEAGRGYLLYFMLNPGGGWKKLFENYTPVYSMTYDLVDNAPCGIGNVISFPEDVLKQLKRFTAEDLCTEIDAQGGTASHVDKFAKQLAQGSIEVITHTCGSQSGNFAINSGVNYRVFVSEPSTLSLP